MELRVLVPVAASETTQKTLAVMIAAKRRLPDRLTLLHVVDADILADKMTPDYQVEMIREKARQAGTGEIRDVLFGSVANYVLYNVKCPVLLFWYG
jgi:nucleotide-binding universal stress UspA family protein